MKSLTDFEKRGDKLAPMSQFLWRMLASILAWLGLTLGGLAIGVAGYALTEGMSLLDAYLNASMILSGMGPVTELKTSGGKFFAGTYAIFSGLVIVIASGVALAPILHRIMHAFHIEEGKDDD